MAIGYYKGRKEQDPGKMIYRHKGNFGSKIRAQNYVAKLEKEGKTAKVVTYTDGYSVYVMAPHDFWKNAFIIDNVQDGEDSRDLYPDSDLAAHEGYYENGYLRETPEQAGYTVEEVSKGEAILRDKETGRPELWAKSPHFAGAAIVINGVEYEFVSGNVRFPHRQFSTPFRKTMRKIAKQTLNMPDAMVGVMGGTNKAEARKILYGYPPETRRFAGDDFELLGGNPGDGFETQEEAKRLAREWLVYPEGGHVRVVLWHDRWYAYGN